MDLWLDEKQAAKEKRNRVSGKKYNMKRIMLQKTYKMDKEQQQQSTCLEQPLRCGSINSTNRIKIKMCLFDRSKNKNKSKKATGSCLKGMFYPVSALF